MKISYSGRKGWEDYMMTSWGGFPTLEPKEDDKFEKEQENPPHDDVMRWISYTWT